MKALHAVPQAHYRVDSSPGIETCWQSASLASPSVPFFSADVVGTPAKRSPAWPIYFFAWTDGVYKQWVVILDSTFVIFSEILREI